MAVLLSDFWLIVSLAGLLLSGILFFFLLGQYRSAADAADQPEPEPAAEPPSPVVRPLSTPEFTAPKSASIPAPKTVEAAAPPVADRPAPVPAQAPQAHKAENATSGVSPAVVYLQNIKLQLEELHGDTRMLAKCVDAITARDEALIERLGELVQAVADLKNSAAVAPPAPAPAPVEFPAPQRAKKKAEPAAESPAVAAPVPAAVPAAAVAAAPVVDLPPKIEAAKKAEPASAPALESKPQPAPLKAPSADETVRLSLEDVIAAQLPKPAPKKESSASPAPSVEAASAPALELDPDDKPRRGPVWPV
jgi:hypothetical protein